MNILKNLKKDSRGFGHIEMIVIVLVIAVIAGVSFFVYKHKATAHAGSWTPIGSLTTVWPNINQTATENLFACVQPMVVSGVSMNVIQVLASSNTIAQTSGLGVVIPVKNSPNTPVAQNLEVDSLNGKKIANSNSASILGVGGAGGGNEQTRGTDLANVQISVQTSTTSPTNFRVLLYQHDKAAPGFPAIRANYYPNNVKGFNFKKATGVSSSTLSGC
jgi:hypothetical protein